MNAADINDHCRRCRNYLDDACRGVRGPGAPTCFEAITNAPGSVNPQTGDAINPTISPVASCCPDGPEFPPDDGPNLPDAVLDAPQTASPPTPRPDGDEDHAAAGTTHRPVAAHRGIFGSEIQGAFSNYPAGKVHYEWARSRFGSGQGSEHETGSGSEAAGCVLIGVSNDLHGNGILTLQ